MGRTLLQVSVQTPTHCFLTGLLSDFIMFSRTQYELSLLCQIGALEQHSEKAAKDSQ